MTSDLVKRLSDERVAAELNAFYGRDFWQYHSELREAMACLLAHGTPARAALSPAPQVTDEAVEKTMSEYSIALQRAIEHHCRGLRVPDNIASDCPHHAKLLNAALSPAPQVTDEAVDAACKLCSELTGLDPMSATMRRVLEQFAASAPSAVEDAVKAER